jgi:hypothetical protein
MARRNEMQSAEVDGITTKAQAAMSKFERRPRDPLIHRERRAERRARGGAGFLGLFVAGLCLILGAGLPQLKHIAIGLAAVLA